jgi:hypothetical protein
MAITAAPAAVERAPIDAAEREVLVALHRRHRVSLVNTLRQLPAIGGLAGVGVVCALAAWQTGWIGHLLFGAGSLFFLWPIPKLVRVGPGFARRVAADLASGQVMVERGPVVRRYYTQGRQGQAHLTLASGADAAVPVTLMHRIHEGDHVVLRRAAQSSCLLSVEYGGERHVMPMELHTGQKP